MDPQLIQQLTQVFQQGLTILQQAGGSAGAGDDATDPTMGGGDDMNMDDDMGDDPTMGGDPGDDPTMGGDGSLHDRVSQLENHTGLKKSASRSAMPLVSRIDQLEDHWLGEQYEGSAGDRIAQLEGVVLGKSAKQQQQQATDAAPDVIPLDALIKTAIQTGIQQALGSMQGGQTAPTDELPDLQQMRKSAKSATNYGRRRGQTTAVSSDADLEKSVSGDGGDDEPIGFADILMAQYALARNGSHLPMDDE